MFCYIIIYIIYVIALVIMNIVAVAFGDVSLASGFAANLHSPLPWMAYLIYTLFLFCVY